MKSTTQRLKENKKDGCSDNNQYTPFDWKDGQITAILIEIELQFGQCGHICVKSVILNQFLDLKSVQKEG